MNGKPVSFERLTFDTANMLSEKSDLQPEQRHMLILKIAESIAVSEALVQQAEKKGIAISDDEIDRRIDFLTSKARQDKSALENVWGYGRSDTIFRREIRKQLATEKLLDIEIRDKIKIPEADAERYYEENRDTFVRDEQVHVLQIFLEGNTPEVLTRATKIREQLTDETDFTDAAENFSQADYDLGYIHKGELDPAFDKVAFSLPENGISKPFASSFGTHILFVKDRIPQGLAPFQAVKNEIINFMSDTLFYPEKQKYIDGIKKKSKIVYNRKILQELAGTNKKKD